MLGGWTVAGRCLTFGISNKLIFVGRPSLQLGISSIWNPFRSVVIFSYATPLGLIHRQLRLPGYPSRDEAIEGPGHFE